MSYCAMILFKDGKPTGQLEFRNSWLGSAWVWDRMFETYLKNPDIPYHTWLGATEKGDRSLWDLAKRSDIPLFMRAVHTSTFDHAIVKQANFAQYYDHLIDFADKFQGLTNNHLREWGKELQKYKDKCEAIGFWATSVSENPFCTYDDETEESIPYNLNTGTKHFEVYEWLKQCDDYKQLEKEVEAMPKVTRENDRYRIKFPKTESFQAGSLAGMLSNYEPSDVQTQNFDQYFVVSTKIDDITKQKIVEFFTEFNFDVKLLEV